MSDEDPHLDLRLSVARIIDLPFGKRQVGFKFDLVNPMQASRVRDWHHGWLQEHRRRLVSAIPSH